MTGPGSKPGRRNERSATDRLEQLKVYFCLMLRGMWKSFVFLKVPKPGLLGLLVRDEDDYGAMVE